MHGAIAALLLTSAPRTLPGATEWLNVELLPAAAGFSAPPGVEADVIDAAAVSDVTEAAPAHPAAIPAPTPPPVAPKPRGARSAPRSVESGEVRSGNAVTSTYNPSATPPDDAVAAWRAALSGWIERYRRYPPVARFRGEEGVVVLRFRIDAAGRVVHVALEQGSGSAHLDTAALALLTDARLPAPPPGLPPEQHSISVPIRYRLR
jgi:periplasmic protein TonB